MQPPRKVFLRYRSVDRERVRTVAEALLARGIDAWWDVWEILPGDNLLSRINDGLDQANSPRVSPPPPGASCMRWK
jgi:TIR domain